MSLVVTVMAIPSALPNQCVGYGAGRKLLKPIPTLVCTCSQSARSLELRAATRLGRIWRAHGEFSEALDLLVPTYGWSTEGFDTADLKEAKTLIDELS